MDNESTNCKDCGHPTCRKVGSDFDNGYTTCFKKQAGAPRPQDSSGSAGFELLARGERGPIDTMSGVFEMGSRKDGDDLTACGRAGINHRMRRFSPMTTTCINPGCDAAC